MNKYFSKTILFGKRVDIIIITSTLAFMYLLNIFNYFLYFVEKCFYNQEILIGTGNIINIIFLIALVLALYGEKEDMYLHLLSEPRKKDSIIYTILITPIVTFLLITIIYGIISSFILLLTIPSIEFLAYFWITLAERLIIIIFMNSYLQFFQLFFRNIYLALLIAIIPIPIITIYILNLSYTIDSTIIMAIYFGLGIIFTYLTVTLNRILPVEKH